MHVLGLDHKALKTSEDVCTAHLTGIKSTESPPHAVMSQQKVVAPLPPAHQSDYNFSTLKIAIFSILMDRYLAEKCFETI